MKNINEAIFSMLISLIRHLGFESEFHLERVGKFSMIIAQELYNNEKFKKTINNEFIENISFASQLHDIGIVSVPGSILLKNGSLSALEYEIVKRHVKAGGEILSYASGKLSNNLFIRMAKDIAYYHHERWDGTGYYACRKYDEIPVCARITAVADIYDACTTSRPYRKAYSHKEALDIIKNGKGNYFDPEIAEAFLAKESLLNSINDQYVELISEDPEFSF